MTYTVTMTPTKDSPNAATVRWTEQGVDPVDGTPVAREQGRYFSHVLDALAWRDERLAAASGVDVTIA